MPETACQGFRERRHTVADVDCSDVADERSAPTGQLQRAVRVLDVLADADQPLTIRAVAECTMLSKSAVHRLLADLVTTDLATQDPATRRYRLGPRTLALGMAYQDRMDVRRVALPFMRSLRDTTGETIGLSVGLGDEVLHIEQVESESPLRARFDIGRPLPLWSGAPSRLLLAERSDEEVRRIVSDRAHPSLAPVNPPSPEALMKEVLAVRGAGHAGAFEETLPGVSTLSVPVHGASGDLAAILSLTAPSSRLDRDQTREVLPSVMETARSISNALGWRGARSSAPRVVTTGPPG